MCVCHRSCGRNFESNLMQLRMGVWGQKTEIEFVKGSKSDNAFRYILPQFFTNLNASSMERSRRAVSTSVGRFWRLIRYLTTPLGRCCRSICRCRDRRSYLVFPLIVIIVIRIASYLLTQKCVLNLCIVICVTACSGIFAYARHKSHSCPVQCPRFPGKQ